MIFTDRKDAGDRLAAVLAEQSFNQPVVLGIPRGGVLVAAQVAELLRASLGVIVARKLHAPGFPELAIGATTASGRPYIDDTIIVELDVSRHYVEAEIERGAAEARRYEAFFEAARNPPLNGREVIIVDDGLATGATAIAAVRAVAEAGARRVVLAAPVGPPSTVLRLRREANDVVCLYVDADFIAVNQFYRWFEPVDDEEVKAVLDTFTVQEAHRKRPGSQVAP